MGKRLPLGAIDAQRKSRSDVKLKELLLTTMRELSKITDPTQLIKEVHRRVDFLQQENPINNISCKKGCHHCCYHFIEISKDELSFLKSLPLSEKQRQKFAKQLDHIRTGKEWEQLPYYERACPFLDKEGACGIYEDRPLVCRMTHVKSPAENCIYDKNLEIELVFHEQANTVILAYLMNNTETYPFAKITED